MTLQQKIALGMLVWGALALALGLALGRAITLADQRTAQQRRADETAERDRLTAEACWEASA